MVDFLGQLPFDSSTETPATEKRRRGPKTTRHKGITRVDHPARRTFGYMARVVWQKKIHIKFFSDKKYGDRLAALSSAIEWRNQMERELGKPRSERIVVSVPRGKSGIIGVRRRKTPTGGAYEASWIEDGKVRRTSFSVRKYGERTARALAMKLRKEKEKARLRAPTGATEERTV